MTQQTNRFTGKTLLILAGVFLFMLVLNILLPIRGDDFLYSMVWETSKHISSWGDLWQSLVNHYTMHGGRMVTVFFLDFFLWMGKLPFDIANAAVFTGVLILLYFHATRDTKLTAEPGILAAAALLMWLCLPHFGEVAVWKSGSTVYLWSASSCCCSSCRTISTWRSACIGEGRWCCPCLLPASSADGPWRTSL